MNLVCQRGGTLIKAVTPWRSRRVLAVWLALRPFPKAFVAPAMVAWNPEHTSRRRPFADGPKAVPPRGTFHGWQPPRPSHSDSRSGRPEAVPPNAKCRLFRWRDRLLLAVHSFNEPYRPYRWCFGGTASSRSASRSLPVLLHFHRRDRLLPVRSLNELYHPYRSFGGTGSCQSELRLPCGRPEAVPPRSSACVTAPPRHGPPQILLRTARRPSLRMPRAGCQGTLTPDARRLHP